MQPKFVSAEELRQQVKGMINYDTTQKMIAERFGVSGAYLSDFLAGRREAGPKILAALDYDKTPFYKPAK
jgi:hypothetical protein